MSDELFSVIGRIVGEQARPYQTAGQTAGQAAASADPGSTRPPAGECNPDSSGTNWFKCYRGTVGCPRIHDGLTPHCIACAAGEPCEWGHEPPALEMTEAAYREFRTRS